MTANELRIGNWVKFTNISALRSTGFAKVEGMSPNYGVMYSKDDDSWWLDPEFIQPIPLTPEILEKCGFVESEEDWLSLVLYNGITIYYNLAYRQISIVSSTDEWQQGSILEQIKALHQLQNLYFALTREELTVNL